MHGNKKPNSTRNLGEMSEESWSKIKVSKCGYKHWNLSSSPFKDCNLYFKIIEHREQALIWKKLNTSVERSTWKKLRNKMR